MELALQKCRRHASREAVARCPECKGFFCRECVTEHEDRLICSDCLVRLTAKGKGKSPSFRWALRGGLGLASFFALWLSFYYLGQFLLSLPSEFHEGTLWSDTSPKDDE
jgi:hypothetical protein